ncbi:globin family protein [Hydrocoleum sp. CS-953]|uniref:globin family protein n=1 Tax=Hydrocoleum sp. CS-953 TaxID=1671698 RepID=UPI000B9B7971|nr:globin family protein [Hydrocoleum sp. CS-953]
MGSKIEIIEQTFAQIKPNAEKFAASFYVNLFREYPELKPLFVNTDMEKQQKKLLDALILVVENLRHGEVLKGVIEALGARHVNYGVLQQHYPAVGKALLETLKEYLQENWNSEVKAAWVSAYRGIAKLMLKGANYQFLPDIKEEIETQEEAQIIPPKININSEIEITKSKVELPIEVIENSFEKIKPYGE